MPEPTKRPTRSSRLRGYHDVIDQSMAARTFVIDWWRKELPGYLQALHDLAVGVKVQKCVIKDGEIEANVYTNPPDKRALALLAELAGQSGWTPEAAYTMYTQAERQNAELRKGRADILYMKAQTARLKAETILIQVTTIRPEQAFEVGVSGAVAQLSFVQSIPREKILEYASDDTTWQNFVLRMGEAGERALNDSLESLRQDLGLKELKQIAGDAGAVIDEDEGSEDDDDE